MCEWFMNAKMAMAVSEERTRRKRRPIVLERLNLMQYVKPIVRSLLSFLF
jgi:predicted transcriptional regulator